MPNPHDWHPLPSPLLYLPAEQNEQLLAEVPPVEVDPFPAGQLVQLAAPPVLNVLAGQVEQVVPPGEYLPAGQLVQSEAESEAELEVVPAAQLVQALPEGAYVPAGHVPQLFEPLAFALSPCPPAQFWQPDPSVEYFPAGHVPQVAWELAPVFRPVPPLQL